MIQINLIPDVKQKYLKAQQTKKSIALVSFLGSGVALGLLGLLALNTFVLQRNHMSNLSEDIKTKIETLQNTPDLDKILTVQNQLTALPGIHDQKPIASRLFEFLPIITPGNVKLTEIQTTFPSSEDANDIGIVLSGATDTFKSANTFVDTLKNATFSYKIDGEEFTDITAFTEVVLSEISKSDSPENQKEATTFTIEFKFDEQIFNRQNTDVKVAVPNIESSVSRTEKPNPFSERGGQ